MTSTACTPEFRDEAVKMVLVPRLTLKEAAQRIEMPKGTLANWVSAARCGTGPNAPSGSRSGAELRPLRKEIAVERMVSAPRHRYRSCGGYRISYLLIINWHRGHLHVRKPGTSLSGDWSTGRRTERPVPAVS